MNLMSVFSVPLWQSDYPEFESHKNIFLEKVREYKDQNHSVQKSNVAGYQSPNTIHHIEELRPFFEYACQMAFQASADLGFMDCDIAITSAWANVNDSRQSMICEHVNENTFSGVFYLSAPEKSGNLCIPNPAINKMWDGLNAVEQKNQFTAEVIRIEPEEGNIVLVPSYLSQYVETNDHDEETISISFNLIVLPKGSLGSMQNVQ